MSIIKSLLISICVLCGCVQLAFAHPAENLTPRECPVYKEFSGDSSWIFGEVKFHSYEDRIPLEELTSIDKFILSGGTDPVNGQTYAAWMNQILLCITQYYEKHGEVPTELSPEVIQSINPEHVISSEFMAMFMNPFTDQPVNLQSTSASPGDMYVKEMSKEEIIALCYVNPTYKRKFGLNLDTNPAEGDEITSMLEVMDPILYYRIYGSNGVLISSVYYRRVSGAHTD